MNETRIQIYVIEYFRGELTFLKYRIGITGNLVTFNHVCFHVIINPETFKSVLFMNYIAKGINTRNRETLKNPCLSLSRSFGVCGCVNIYRLQISKRY